MTGETGHKSNKEAAEWKTSDQVQLCQPVRSAGHFHGGKFCNTLHTNKKKQRAKSRVTGELVSPLWQGKEEASQDEESIGGSSALENESPDRENHDAPTSWANVIAAKVENLVSLANNTLFFAACSVPDIFPPPLSQKTSLQFSYGDLIIGVMGAYAFAKGSEKAHSCEYEVAEAMDKIAKGQSVWVDGKEITYFETVSGDLSAYYPSLKQYAIIGFDLGNHALDVGAQMIIMKLSLTNFPVLQNIAVYGVLPACGFGSSFVEAITTFFALMQRNALQNGQKLDFTTANIAEASLLVRMLFNTSKNENVLYFSALSNTLPGAISLGYSIALCLNSFLNFEIKNNNLNIAYETLLIGIMASILPAIGYAHTLYLWGLALRSSINITENEVISQNALVTPNNNSSTLTHNVTNKLAELYQQCLDLYVDIYKRWASLKFTSLKLALLGYAIVTSAFLVPFVIILNTTANLSKPLGTALAFSSFIIGGLLRTGDTKSALTFVDAYAKNQKFETSSPRLGNCFLNIFSLKRNMSSLSRSEETASTKGQNGTYKPPHPQTLFQMTSKVSNNV